MRLPVISNLLKMHITVFIWGFTGVFGDLISISALPLVWFRVVISAIFVWIFIYIRNKSLFLPLKQIIYLLFIGLILGIHWLCFYYAIKTSTVGLAVVCLSAQTLFTALLEPIMCYNKLSRIDIIIGIIIIIGMSIIFHFECKYYLSIIIGIFAALLASIFTILNIYQIKNNSASVICFYEMLGGAIGLTAIIIYLNITNSLFILSYSLIDIIYILILSIIFTALPQIISIHVMHELSPYTIMLLSSLEPIYSILIALLILGSQEQMTLGFYLGSILIILAIFIHPFVKKSKYIN